MIKKVCNICIKALYVVFCTTQVYMVFFRTHRLADSEGGNPLNDPNLLSIRRAFSKPTRHLPIPAGAVDGSEIRNHQLNPCKILG